MPAGARQDASHVTDVGLHNHEGTYFLHAIEYLIKTENIPVEWHQPDICKFGWNDKCVMINVNIASSACDSSIHLYAAARDWNNLQKSLKLDKFIPKSTFKDSILDILDTKCVRIREIVIVWYV